MPATTERVINYLVVEDNDAHAQIVEMCFRYEKLPCDVRRVKTGADCLAYLAGEEPFADRNQYPYPDVVLLDIHMPGVLDGLQTLKAIRTDPQCSSISVMMLTSSDRDLDVRRAYRLGANGYIAKSDDTGTMIEKLLQLHHSFDTFIELPERKQGSSLGSPRETGKESRPFGDVESLSQSNQDATLSTLVSTYQKDRDETLELLKGVEQFNTTRFASLAQRFCVEQRGLFAGGQDVDWVFIREVVMDKLPRYTSPRKMAGLVASITAVLEGNEAARKDESSWQLWQGFCRAHLNQGVDLPAEVEKQGSEPLPELSQRWKAVAIAALVMLFALLLAIIVRELF